MEKEVVEDRRSSSDTEGTLTIEKHRWASSQSFNIQSEDDDAIFKTCKSERTEGTSGSPPSSHATVSKKINWNKLYDHAQLRTRSEVTDDISDRGSHRSDVRGFLTNIYGEQSRRMVENHQRLKEHQMQITESIKSIEVNDASVGTPIRKSREQRGENNWATSRHSALEQLRAELEDRLREDANFRPELRELKTDEVVMMGSHYDFNSEEISVTPILKEQYISIIEPTIELSNLQDITETKISEPLHFTEEEKLERRQRKEAKWRDKELEECTFHPRVSPTSRTLFNNSSFEKGNVFCRLYPQQDEKKDDDKEEEREKGEKSIDESHRKYTKKSVELLAQEERELLRERCGGISMVEAGGETFDIFLKNVLSLNNNNNNNNISRSSNNNKKNKSSVYIKTDYKSSLAQKLNALISMESVIASEKKTEQRRYRLACFDEFLQRQNAHHGNRSRSIRNLEKALTPSFKPEITDTTIQIAKELLARSANTTPDSSNISALASAVKKHRSPYVDPCTFKPKISPVASAMAPRGVKDMLKDNERWQKAKQAARQKAIEAESKHSFRPVLNVERNAHVESFLNPKNYTKYEQGLRQQRERMLQLKKEKDAMRENEEVNRSAFRPKITRKPAYVARMASSFSLVRQQYGEL